MAAVIGDFVSDPSRFHTMIANPSHQHQTQHQQSHNPSSLYRNSSDRVRQASGSVPASSTRTQQQHSHKPAAWSPAGARGAETHVSGGGASRFPSPPSSSPAPTVAADDTNAASMASQTAREPVSLGHHHPQSLPATAAAATNTHTSATNSNNVTDAFTNHANLTRPQQQQPSPPSDEFHASTSAAAAAPSLPVQDGPSAYPSAEVAAATPASPQQTIIHIRDLAHVQSLARADMRAGNGSGILNDPPLQQMKYEISAMPIGDIIEMVAALLTKITSTNDLQHDAMQRNQAHQQQANQSSESSGSSSMSPLSHSVLAFHGKNVPAITILSYLSRIHKYCPTTYEVFLSLLVYFDRMTERVNELVAKSEEARRTSTIASPRTSSEPPLHRDTAMHDEGDEVESDSDDSDSDLADDDDEEEDDEMEDSASGSNHHTAPKIITASSDHTTTPGAATYFVVDSFNIHRLIIAGVTCASKFFSDVFYTNSRYAKVGGLPLPELNHLELQFLVLNEFRLFVPVEDLEAYATMLVEFYAREVVGKQPDSAARK